MHTCMDVCTYVCVYVCNVCMHVSMPFYVYAYMYLGIHVSMYVSMCVYACMHACVHMYPCTIKHRFGPQAKHIKCASALQLVAFFPHEFHARGPGSNNSNPPAFRA